MFTRREFIKTGFLGGMALAATRVLPVAAEETAAADARDALFTAIIPVILADALPTAPEERRQAISTTRANLHTAIAGLAPRAQSELADLFRLLSIRPLRWVLTGVASDWSEASPDAVATFLDRWRHSIWALPQTGYQALTQLVIATWYGNPAAWPATGYAGPPQLER